MVTTAAAVTFPRMPGTTMTTMAAIRERARLVGITTIKGLLRGDQVATAAVVAKTTRILVDTGGRALPGTMMDTREAPPGDTKGLAREHELDQVLVKVAAMTIRTLVDTVRALAGMMVTALDTREAAPIAIKGLAHEDDLDRVLVKAAHLDRVDLVKRWATRLIWRHARLTLSVSPKTVSQRRSAASPRAASHMATAPRSACGITIAPTQT